MIFFSSCVPNRKLVYLQKDDLKNRKEILKDTILRTHPLSIQEYRIQPLDVLNINFETLAGDEDSFDFLSQLSSQNRQSGGGSGLNPMINGIVVDSEGFVKYPVLGKIKVQGMTIFEAEESIRAVAAKFVRDVVVRVRMLNFRYTILGEVNAEATITSNNTRMTLMEAIGMAGGLTELADRSHLKVIRQKGDSAKVFYVNLLEEELLSSNNFYVHQNDIIVVPPLRQRPFRKYFSNNLALFSSVVSLILVGITLYQLR